MEISELKPLLNHPFLFILHVFLLDLIFGDPVFHLHPIRIIGRLIIIFEKVLMRVGLNGRVGGILLFVLSWSVVLGLTGIVYYSLLSLHWLLAWLWKLFICFSMFALKDLIVHARRIASATQNNQLEQARYHASMLVGRDTDKMDTKACNRAAVESVSESLVDSVIAPLFYLYIFGMAGLITFKIFSTNILIF